MLPEDGADLWTQTLIMLPLWSYSQEQKAMKSRQMWLEFWDRADYYLKTANFLFTTLNTSPSVSFPNVGWHVPTDAKPHALYQFKIARSINLLRRKNLLILILIPNDKNHMQICTCVIVALHGCRLNLIIRPTYVLNSGLIAIRGLGRKTIRILW